MGLRAIIKRRRAVVAQELKEVRAIEKKIAEKDSKMAAELIVLLAGPCNVRSVKSKNGLVYIKVIWPKLVSFAEIKKHISWGIDFSDQIITIRFDDMAKLFVSYLRTGLRKYRWKLGNAKV